MREVSRSAINLHAKKNIDLDDSSLDTRLTFIRRQSGLDSRAALFVLSPVSASELNDFVRR